MELRTALLVAAAVWAVGAPTMRAGIVQAEYFAGSDPGVGLASPLVLTNATNGVSADLEAASIPLSGLAPGTHEVGVRVKDSAGRWSTTLLRRVRVYPSSFSIPDPSPIASTSNVTIVAAEYFVGADPGAGAGTALGVGTDGAAAQLDEVRLAGPLETGP